MNANRIVKSLSGRLKVGGILLVVLVIGLAVSAVIPFLIQLLWGWVVPDLFPGAVAQGLVAGSISWYTAFKLSILLLVFGIVASQYGK
ncbi:MAG: hypothetical protein IMX00_00580 [Limnochordales bacterium]|nr:hypothetical protein [Limnochordales bacterium]